MTCLKYHKETGSSFRKRLREAAGGGTLEELLERSQTELTVTAHRLTIERHEGIKEYGRQLIVAAGKHWPIRVRGEDLCLEAMDGHSLVIGGRISSVELGREPEETR